MASSALRGGAADRRGARERGLLVRGGGEAPRAAALRGAVSGRTIADVVRWIDTQNLDEALDVLEQKGPEEALRALEASARRESRQLSSIYTTAETVLAAYADPRVLASARVAEITPEALLDGRANTLYLCAPAHEQRRLAPLFATLVEEVVSAVYEAASSLGGPIEPPLLIVGDELANIAPIPSLAEIASTGAGQGIQLVSVFQDLGQVRQRWGEGWRTVVNNHRAKLFGAGIADPDTLAYVREVTGESEYRQLSDTEGLHGDRSRTEATTYRALAPASVVREGEPGTAVLVYGHLPPARLRLRPFYGDRTLRRLAGGAGSRAARQEEADERSPLLVRGGRCRRRAARRRATGPTAASRRFAAFAYTTDPPLVSRPHAQHHGRLGPRPRGAARDGDPRPRRDRDGRG